MATTSIYRGTCDASAAVRIGETDRFVAASDEDSVLRVFDRAAPGLPVASVDLVPFLDPADPSAEPDLEGAAQLGDRVYWIGSHGRNKDGVEQPNRQCFLATRIDAAGPSITITPIGHPYRKLLRDLLDAPELASMGLKEAAQQPPESDGGLNIEGLAPASDGSLLIGFRNPIPQGRAIVARLHNPAALVDGQDERGVLTLAGALDLGGRGIRALEFVPSAGLYAVLAGAFNDTRNFALFLWSGRAEDAPVPLDVAAVQELNPEELIVLADPDGGHTIELLSDDGDVMVGTDKCKKLKKHPERQSFRSIRFQVALT